MAVFISRDADPLATTASITGNVATYGGLSVGSPAADRIVIAVVSYEFAATATPVSCVIFTGTGDRATMDAGPAIQFSTTVGVAIFKRHYPAGSAASFDITFANAPTTTNHHITIYDATGSTGLFTTSGTNTSTDMDVTTPLSIAITVPASGEAIAVASCAADATTHTWANMTSDLDVDAGTFQHVTGLRTTAGATTVTLTGVTNLEDGAIAIAVFSAGTIALPANKTTSITDVPKPREYPLSLRTWVNDPQGPFPPSAPPIWRQKDWPVPVAREYPLALRTWVNDPGAPFPPFTAAAAATYMPGRVSEWGMWQSVPFTPADLPENIALQQPAVIDRPKNQYNWPLPQSAPRNLSLSTWINAGITAAEEVAVEYVFRAPNYTPRWAGARFETWTTSVNLALRAVAPPQKPFTQTDWPLTPAARQPDRTYQRSFPPELIGKDRLPIRQQSWPLTAAPYYDISLRTFLAINPPLLATSAPPPILMPPLIIEWGISDRIPFQPANIQYNAPLLTAPVVPVQPPFNQDDWPVPPTPQRAADLRTFINDTPIQLIGKDQLPVRQQDWKLSIAADYSVSLRSFLASPGLPLTTAPVVQPPFAQDDWPVPSAQRQPDRTWQRAFPPTLVGQDQFPVRQQIWPVPIATEFSNALRSIGFRSPALDVVSGRPFVQNDWPVPAAARQPDRTFQRSFPPTLVGKDRLPIRQQDWPLPIAPRPAADLRTYIAQSPIRLIGKDRLPFRQMHWPVPLAPLEFHTLRSITQGRVIYGGEVAPIPPEPPLPPPEVIHSVRAHADAYYGVSYFDEIKGRADFSRAKGSNDEEAAN